MGAFLVSRVGRKMSFRSKRIARCKREDIVRYSKRLEINK